MNGLISLALQIALDMVVLAFVYLPTFYIFKANAFSPNYDNLIRLVQANLIFTFSLFFFFRIFFRFLFISSFVNYFFGDVALTFMIHVFPFIHSTRPPHSPPNFPISSLPLLPSCAQVGLEQYREGFPNDLPALLTCWVPADLVCFSIALHLRLPIRHIWSFFWTVYLSYFRGARK